MTDEDSNYANDAVQNAAAEQVNDSEEPIDLDELESKVRAQLKDLISRAKKCRDQARDLLQRTQPFREVREPLNEIVNDTHSHVSNLLENHTALIGHRVTLIRDALSALRKDVAFRQEAAQARRQTLRNDRMANGSAGTRWHQAAQQWRTELLEGQSELRVWLGSAEQRWAPEEAPENDETQHESDGP